MALPLEDLVPAIFDGRWVLVVREDVVPEERQPLSRYERQCSDVVYSNGLGGQVLFSECGRIRLCQRFNPSTSLRKPKKLDWMLVNGQECKPNSRRLIVVAGFLCLMAESAVLHCQIYSYLHLEKNVNLSPLISYCSPLSFVGRYFVYVQFLYASLSLDPLLWLSLAVFMKDPLQLPCILS